MSIKEKIEEKAKKAAQKAAAEAQRIAEEAGRTAAEAKKKAEEAARQATADVMENVFPSGFKAAVQNNKKFASDLVRAIQKVNPTQATLEEASKITESQWQQISEQWRAKVRADPTLVNQEGQANENGRKVLLTILEVVVLGLGITGALVLLVGALLCLGTGGVVAFGVVALYVGTLAACAAIGVGTTAAIVFVWAE